MAFDLLNKEFFLGVGGSLGYILAGGMAFSRVWMSNKAKNANDTQHIDMLDRQDKSIDRLESKNASLEKQLEEKNKELTQYFKDLSIATGKLQLIEHQLELLKQQNDALSQQVSLLTETNRGLAKEIAHLRATMRI